MAARGQCYAPTALPPKKDSRLPFVQNEGWVSGVVWNCRKNVASTGARSPYRPVPRPRTPTHLPQHLLSNTLVLEERRTLAFRIGGQGHSTKLHFGRRIDRDSGRTLWGPILSAEVTDDLRHQNLWPRYGALIRLSGVLIPGTKGTRT
jgi:hypothetical protein